LKRQPDRDEENGEQHAAEGFDIRFKLMPVGGFGEHDAGEKRAHRHGKPGELHQAC
jgi:hypothetical protein